MLYIVGLGLDDGEITLKGRDALEECDKAYVEFYTNTETVDIGSLEEQSGTEIERLKRKEVEQDMKPVNAASSRDTAFLVSGDPLTATTHYQLKKEAESRGIEVEICHAPSIITSVAETGLDVYKLGRAVTIPEDSEPKSIGKMISKNDSIGLHTLVLLDVNLLASRAAEKLMAMDESLAEREVAVLERANSTSQSINVSSLEDVPELEIGETPHCMVLIGDTSHKEEEFLEEYR